MPTGVKVLSGGILQNVVLSGDSGNTFPTNYTVIANDTTGNPKTFNYNNIVTDFTSNLTNQTEGDGKFSVKATLVSIIAPTISQQGSITWLLESTGRLVRGGDVTIASSTRWAYLSARVTSIQLTQTVDSGTQVVNASPGVIGRGMIAVNANSVAIDSYKSSKGIYNVPLAANTYPGQQGGYNLGSRGDVRTNDEFNGYIKISNGIVTGGGYSTFAAPQDGQTDPITIDPAKVLYSTVPTSVPFDVAHKYYDQPALTFPDIPAIPRPPSGSTDYSLSKSSAVTLPAGNYNNLSISKGALTVPPGNYGSVDLSAQATIVLGVQGQTTTYNFQGFVSGAQTTIIYKGPVIINVQSSLTIGGQGNTADKSIPASAIHWNFKGGNGEVVSIGGGGDTLGVFYAPNNNLVIGGNGPFYGAIAARNVDINGTGAIHVDEDALMPVTTTVTTHTTTVTTVGYTATSYSLWRIT